RVLIPPYSDADVRLLDCSNNRLTDVPASLSGMRSLEQLYLRHNKLRRLPRVPAPALKELFAGNNQIEQLEAEQLACLTAVSQLELRDNKIRKLPEEIPPLLPLTRLDLTNNDISSLPASLSLLPNLKVLLLEGNPLRGIRRELLAKGTSDLLKYLRGRIKEEPEGAAEGPTALTLPSEALVNLQKVQTLKTLEFSNKQAAEVPEQVFDAAAHQAIITADFSRNQLTSFPSGLLQFQSSLSDLSLAFNRLTCCSPHICSFTLLAHLDLRNNQLTDLPCEMKTLPKLRSVILNYNRYC
ncbi:PREDICTED: leucine-rich repeat-containing protein 40, partial [Cyprinodon variegatus]|uniref:leucine-rich repeat-containing protein 40 n=1 Tax=Cyprinodon variegatus TaxID=28743 RepID=UPI000742A730